MRVEGRREERNDEFPVGMRVLAVDDDPICLKLLETLLRKCQYHVTTTSQSIRALEMLRENKNKFDLVISDVHMPDMDGFKLLELVGLEMDLPVIMLSAHGDTKLVMKGITHGACDYLLKPVRMEELKNIWQHVVRRKRSDPGDHSSNSHGKNSGERNGTGCGNSNADAKLCKKRKDQNSDDEDDDSDNENENDDPSTQKRPRVVWSVELHQKFVAAVNQLGLDKAVPKQILNLMNVEKLTRENVASHLQKYRLYLKRISSVANQQANMVAALGGPNSPYLRMTSVNLHGFSGSQQFPTNALRSVPPGVLSRLNTPTGLGLHGLAPSSMAQLGHGQIPRQPNLLPGDQSRSLLQGRPASLELNQLQPKNDNSRIFPISSNADLSGSSNSLQSHDTFGINSDLPPNLLVHNRCNGDWPNAMQNSTSHDAPMNILGQTPLQDSRMDGPCLAGFGLMGDNVVQNMTYGPKQVWDDNRMDLLNHTDFLDGSVNTSMGSNQDVFPCTPVLNRNTSFGAMAQPKFDSIGTENNQLFEKSKHGGFVEQGRSSGNYGCNGAGSLEDVVTAMFKKEQDHVEEWRYPL